MLVKTCMHLDGYLIEPEGYSEELLRSWSKVKLRCQWCGAPVFYRHGSQVSPHFAHLARRECEFWEPETIEHIEGKRLLKAWIEQIYPFNVTKQEYYLDEIGQRADVMTIFPDGHRLCIEYQCSPISDKDLRTRIEGYEKMNISQVWIMGHGLFKERPLTRFRLHAWEDMIRKRQKMRLYLLESLGSHRLITLTNITAVRDRKTLFTSGERTEWALRELRVSREGSITLVDGSALVQMKEPATGVTPNKPKQLESLASRKSSLRMIRHRSEAFLTNPLRGFAISRVGDYLSHPVMNQQIEGDHLFMIDHRLWQSYLFLTEIHKVYQRRSMYGTGTLIPRLFIKHILIKDARFPERPFQSVLKRYVNQQLAYELRMARSEGLIPRMKTIHELVYEYFSRLATLGFLKNMTPNQERITPGGKLFGKFDVQFDQFCPELFGETEHEMKTFFRNHKLCYIKNRWFDCTGNQKRPLHFSGNV